MLELLPSKTEEILNFREVFKIKEFMMNTNKKGYHVQMSRMDYGITGFSFILKFPVLNLLLQPLLCSKKKKFQ